jgi:hypothetical protein
MWKVTTDIFKFVSIIKLKFQYSTSFLSENCPPYSWRGKPVKVKHDQITREDKTQRPLQNNRPSTAAS